MLVKLGICLFRVVRNVEGDVEKERFLLVLFEELDRLFCGEIREVLSVFEDLVLLIVEIVKAGAV